VDHIALMGLRHTYKILFGKPEGKTLHERPSRRWGIILKLFSKLVSGSADWIHLVRCRVQRRAVVISITKLHIP
jgi:hypothetical protein